MKSMSEFSNKKNLYKEQVQTKKTYAKNHQHVLQTHYANTQVQKRQPLNSLKPYKFILK